MIPEREREALMRLTMCAREECRICMYQKRCDFDFQCKLATKNMNILADALRKTEPSNSEIPNNCERDRFFCKWLGVVDVCGRCRNRNLFAEADTEPKAKDEPQKERSEK